MEITDGTAAAFATRVWISSYDGNETNASFAKHLWEASEMEIGPRFRNFLVPLLCHEVEEVRLNTGRAIAAALKIHPGSLRDTLTEIYRSYFELVRTVVSVRQFMFADQTARARIRPVRSCHSKVVGKAGSLGSSFGSRMGLAMLR